MESILDNATVAVLWSERREILESADYMAGDGKSDAGKLLRMNRELALVSIQAAESLGGPRLRRLAAYHLLTLQRLCLMAPVPFRVVG